MEGRRTISGGLEEQEKSLNKAEVLWRASTKVGPRTVQETEARCVYQRAPVGQQQEAVPTG